MDATLSASATARKGSAPGGTPESVAIVTMSCIAPPTMRMAAASSTSAGRAGRMTSTSSGPAGPMSLSVPSRAEPNDEDLAGPEAVGERHVVGEAPGSTDRRRHDALGSTQDLRSSVRRRADPRRPSGRTTGPAHPRGWPRRGRRRLSGRAWPEGTPRPTGRSCEPARGAPDRSAGSPARIAISSR